MATRSRLAADLVVGSRVTVTGKKGVVKFIGTTKFAAGDWIGVELDSPDGKNNGTVSGVRYFDGQEGHGLFVKKAQVRLDRGAASSSTASAASDGSTRSDSVSSPRAAGSGKVSSRLAAIREKNKARKETLAAVQTSPRIQRRASASLSIGGPRSPGVESLQGFANVPSSPASVASGGSIGSEKRRASHMQAITRSGYDAQESKPSAASDISDTDRDGSGRTRKIFGEAPSASSASSSAASQDKTHATRATGIPSFRGRASLSANRRMSGLESPLPVQPVGSMPPPASAATRAPSRSIERAVDKHCTDGEMDALRARVAGATSEAEAARARLAETAEKLDESEAYCRDVEGKLAFLVKKSEHTLSEQRSKLSALAKEKAAGAAAGRREAEMESQMSELTDACEALTLDKEQLALENEELQERMDELVGELASTKLDMEHAQLSAKENEAAARALSDAGGAGGDGGVNVKLLAEQNMQLKEGLKRLHTRSIAEKTDLTKAIRALQKDVASNAALHEEVDKLRSWKESKAKEIKELMEQLDESKAYEEMVEALTTKNLELGEKCGELEAIIADLESSVELSEELEMEQAEEIQELQRKLAGGEVSLHNQKLALSSVIKELNDTKQTIDRFREYAEQLKSSRDELATASNTDVDSSAAAYAEKRTLLTQKASMQRMATETRRAKLSERLLQIGLLDAQARSSRLSMLIPGSLALAETELRHTDADLSLCRLVRKACLALEIIELPAIEFVDALGTAPTNLTSDEGGEEVQPDPTLDRAALMEDCSRLALETEQSLPIAQTVREALAVLDATVLVAGSNMSPDAVLAVSAEVASSVTEAEGLVDGLLGVIQDEGGLPPAGCASTVSVLSATAKSIGMRRSAALASAATGTGNDGSADTVDTVQGRKGSEGSNGSIAAAVAAFQDCLICARRAVLAVMGAILRDTHDSRISVANLSAREDGQAVLWQTTRGLWSDLTALRSVSNAGGARWCDKLEQLASGVKDLSAKIATHAKDTQKTAPTASELAEQVVSLRLTAKELLRSPLVGAVDQEAGCKPALCPRVMWHAVAPWLVTGASRSPGGPRSGGGADASEAPCLPRADSVRASLKEAMDLKPELEISRAQVADLTVELASRSKEVTAATSKREQLEALLEKAEGSQAVSADLQEQILILQGTSSKLEQENKFMTEALEDLQDSTSRLEAENRTLKNASSPTKRIPGTPGAGGSGKHAKAARARGTPAAARLAVGETPATDVAAVGPPAAGSARTTQESDESLTMALNWSQAEIARWRGQAFTSVLSGLKPIPHLSVAQGGRSPSSQQAPATSKDASDSLRELISLSKKLAAVREPPRVIGVQGAAQVSQVTKVGASYGGAGGVAVRGNSADSGEELCSSSASATWQAQQVINARLESEWREGQGRAAKVLTSLLGSGAGGSTAFGRGMAADLPTPQTYQGDSNDSNASGTVRVARLRLPSAAHFGPFKTRQAAVPITLERPSLARLQQALTV